MPFFRQTPALLALLLLFIVEREAHASGFALVAPSLTGRAYSTSTLLPSGRVLVVGGEDANGTLLASAEIYDPSTNKWSSTAPLITAREHHTAALLPSGKVLVVGGIGANATMLATAEIYDPSANAWSLAGTLAEGRAYHTMTQLPSGKVLVAGGQTGASPATKTVELYDPSTNSWSAASNLKYSRTSHVAALLPSGKVIVAGGYTDTYPMGGSPYMTSVEQYDPESDTWIDRAPLLTGRRFATATVLASGRVLVAGGYSSAGFEARAERYDPASDAWSSIASLITPRMSFTATLLPSGKLMVIGGFGATGAIGTSEIYDPVTGTWSSVSNLLPGRSSHTATLLASGQVLVATGAVVGGVAVGAERYDSGGDGWAQTNALKAARSTHTATRLVSGKVLIAGGSSGVPLGSAELYDPATSTFAFVPSLSIARTGQTATLLLSGKVLVVGGMGTNSTYLSSVEIFDPINGSWQPAAPLVTPRALHTATLLPSGKVLVVAGINSSGHLQSAEIYDPVADTWVAVGSLSNARILHSATLLRTGKVLVAGGSNGGAVNSAELFDPASGTWQPTGALATSRYSHTATLLQSGKVLVAGGASNGSFAATYELYDPFAGTWSTTASLLTPRASHTATLLASGDVLVAGGNDSSSTPLASTERYDPMINASVLAGSLATARAYHGATYLPSGRVLIEGGVGSGNATLLSAELYDPGLGFADGRRPIVTATNDPTTQGTPLILTGTGLTGDTEAAGGNSSQASSTNYPLVQMRRLDNDQVVWTLPDVSSTSWEGTYQTQPLNGLPLGQYVVTAFANAIPSLPKMLLLTGPASSIVVAHGSPQSASVNSPFLPMQARVVDSANDPVWGAAVTFTPPANGASATCVPAGTATNANGLAQTTCTANGMLGSYAVTASTAGAGIPASFALTNVTGPPATITTSAGSSQSTIVNTAFALALKAKVFDSGSNPVAGAAVTFSVPGSGASATCTPANPVLTDANGLATVTCAANATAGAYAVNASTDALPPAVFSLTNLPGAAATITIVSGGGQSTPINAAFLQPLGVSVVDSFNNGIGNVAVTFVVPPNGASATCPAATTDANGHAQTTCMANATSGSYTVKAGTDALNSPAVPLTNLVGAAASITAQAGSAQSTVVNTVFAVALKAKVVDSGNNPVMGAAVTFAVPGSGASATCLPANPVLTDSGGVATVTCTADTVAGSYAVEASTGALPPAPFGLTNVAGAAAAITITSGGWQSTPVNTVFPQPLAVSVVDSFNNGIGNVPVTFVVPSNGASAVCPAATTDASGHAQTTCTANATAGSYTVKAATGALSSAAVSLTNLAGAAATIAMQAGSPQSTMVGTMFGTDLQAKVTDVLNNPVSGASVLFTGPPSGASATCSPLGATTGANGIATSTCTANAIAGSYTLSASTSGVPTPAVFNLTNLPGVAASITIQSGSQQSTVVNTVFAQSLKAKVVDSGSNPVAGVAVAFTVSGGGASATCVPANPVLTDVNGLATVTCTANTIAGSYAVEASTGALPPVAFGLTNVPGAAAAIAITSGGGQSTPVNTAFAQPLAVSVVDGFNNGIGNVPVTFVAPLDGASAVCSTATTSATGHAQTTCTANATSGSYAVEAGTGALTSAAVSLTNLAGAPASITILTGSAQSTAANTAFAQPLKVKVMDSGSNPVAGAAVTFAPPGSGASATCVPANPVLTDAVGIAMVTCTANTIAGSYSVQVNTGALSPAQFSLTNVPGGAAAIAITSGGGQSTPVNTAFAQPLVVSVIDGFNNGIGNAPITFVVPSNGASAVCPAATTDANGHAQTTCAANAASGSYTVKASTGALMSTSVPLTNLAGAAASIGYMTGPSDAVAGANIAPPIVLHMQDAYGNPVAGDGITLTLAANPGGATLTGGGMATTNASGDATFAGVSLDRAGTGYTLKATDSNLIPLMVTSSSFNISAAAAAAISYATGPSSAAAGLNIAPPIVVHVQDANGNPVAGDGITLTLVANPGGSTLTGGGTVMTDASGDATFSGVSLNRTGFGYTLRASDSSANPLAVISAPFDISAGAAASIAMQSGSPQSTMVETSFGAPLQAKVTDAQGNPLSGVSVLFTVPPSGASATCSPVDAATDSEGVAQTTCTANNIVGTYVVNVSYESLTPAGFDLSNFGPLAVVCMLPAQIGVVGDSVNIDLVPLFDAPGQALTYDALGLPPSLTVDSVNGLIDGTLNQNDVPGSPYMVTLRATGDAGSVDEQVRFEVLDPGDIVFRHGFEDPANQQECL